MVGTWEFAPVSTGALEYLGVTGTWHADADVGGIWPQGYWAGVESVSAFNFKVGL